MRFAAISNWSGHICQLRSIKPPWAGSACVGQGHDVIGGPRQKLATVAIIGVLGAVVGTVLHHASVQLRLTNPRRHGDAGQPGQQHPEHVDPVRQPQRSVRYRRHPGQHLNMVSGATAASQLFLQALFPLPVAGAGKIVRDWP